MSEELNQQEEGFRRCSYCGNSNVIGINFDITTEWRTLYIKCPDCGVVLQATKERYNTRPLEDVFQRKLDIAVEALNKFINPPIAINDSEMQVLQWTYQIAQETLKKLEE